MQFCIIFVSKMRRVVVCDDHIHAQSFREINFIKTQRSVINGDYQFRASLGNLRNRILIQAIAFRETVWRISVAIEPETAQTFPENHRCRHAVNIVISVNRYFLTALLRSTNSRNRFVHALKQIWIIASFRKIRIQKILYLLIRFITPPRQKFAKQR